MSQRSSLGFVRFRQILNELCSFLDLILHIKNYVDFRTFLAHLRAEDSQGELLWSLSIRP